MIKSIFINNIRFAIFFLLILLVDVYVKIYSNNPNDRFLTKPLVLLSLITYYYFNKKHKNQKLEQNVLLAFIFFLLGDIMILNYLNSLFLTLSMLFFGLGKVFFCLKFKSKEDFEFSRLLPFSVIIYIFITFIISVVYKNLQAFLIPGLITLFISLLMLNLAYLRKDKFSKESYLYVLFGCILFVLVESFNAIYTFNKNLPFPNFLIVLFYGISIYLIVVGIVKERIIKVLNETDNDA
ncbi:lysoplasmalogenase family protein [Confluentibacter lentus]|uniref:lysoplasmalogenase family protein n=1 Tax=Confluentibacter lentus TaxID=1699412 RepID=UPI000C290245|nr:lysoplasmalogenase family protein [Confluentibacter lentus]